MRSTSANAGCNPRFAITVPHVFHKLWIVARWQACGQVDAAKALSCPQVRQPSALPSAARVMRRRSYRVSTIADRIALHYCFPQMCGLTEWMFG
jgi:hypothetical protein